MKAKPTLAQRKIKAAAKRAKKHITEGPNGNAHDRRKQIRAGHRDDPSWRSNHADTGTIPE